MASFPSTRSGLVGLAAGALVLMIGLAGFNLEFATFDPVGASHPASELDGAEIYLTRCMSCHQMNGAGVPGVFPPLSDSDWVTGDKGRLIRVILGGMTGKIEVNGESYSGAMPPWGSFLDDTEMSELLTYIRTSWDNDAEPITPEEVQKVRDAIKDRKEPWTQEDFEDESNLGIPGQE